ncbi:hypothetical protein M9H77_23288 [Catharanthus roseus]|uniref:Uncharacterized protein n=1 Tax=Catharanthus roseus TaxID=4058 RepID=A0ACC0AUL0_CATRO|nr:hypothetical protein M9H77_23288 [Catharanthus roseus]
MFSPSCYGFGNLDDTSLVEPNIAGFEHEFDRNSLQHVRIITLTRGRRHTMEFEDQGENVARKLILCYGDLTMSFSSNLFLFYLVFSFKELKLFLELNAFYVILVGKWTLCGDFHAKFKGEFAENCDYQSSFLYASKKNFDGFIPFIKLLCLVSYKFEFPHEEQKVLTLLFGNIHGIQFYHFHFKEFKWLVNFRKKMNGILKVFKAHLCDLEKTTFGNGNMSWNFYGVETLVDKLDALFAYSVLSLECLGNFHSVVPFNASISNVACLLWLIEGIKLRTTPSKRGADGMIQDVQETIELLQGLEHKKELSEEPRHSYFPSCKWKKLKKQVLKILKLQTKRRRRLEPYHRWQVMAREEERLPTADDRFTLLSPVGFWPNTCLRCSIYRPW